MGCFLLLLFSLGGFLERGRKKSQILIENKDLVPKHLLSMISSIMESQKTDSQEDKQYLEGGEGL